MTGISDPYEEPVRPEVIVDNDQESPEQSLEKILQHVQATNFIQRDL